MASLLGPCFKIIFSLVGRSLHFYCDNRAKGPIPAWVEDGDRALLERQEMEHNRKVRDRDRAIRCVSQIHERTCSRVSRSYPFGLAVRNLKVCRQLGRLEK